jgi:hypothetical protein
VAAVSKRVVIIVASVVGMVLLVGCGSVTTFVLLRLSPLDETIQDAVADDTYTQADVEAALLTETDLPDYTKEPNQPDEGGADLTPCGRALDLRALGQAGTDREVTFSQSELGPFVLQIAGLLRNDVTLEPIRAAFRDCPSWAQDSGDEYTAAEEDYGNYGDETFSIRLSLNSDGVSITLNLVFVRQGNLLSALVVAGFPDVNPEQVRELAKKAADKLPS